MVFLQFQFSDLSAPLPGNFGPSTLRGIWIYHNIIFFLQFSKVFFGYFHQILHLVLFLIAYDCYFQKRVVFRGIVSPAVVLVSSIGKHVVLRVHILALKVEPLLFHSPTLVLSQCTTSLTSLRLPFILFQFMLSGVRHSLLLDI